MRRDSYIHTDYEADIGFLVDVRMLGLESKLGFGETDELISKKRLVLEKRYANYYGCPPGEAEDDVHIDTPPRISAREMSPAQLSRVFNNVYDRALTNTSRISKTAMKPQSCSDLTALLEAAAITPHIEALKERTSSIKNRLGEIVGALSLEDYALLLKDYPELDEYRNPKTEQAAMDELLPPRQWNH